MGYFDPLAGQFRIASHPHSNVATARKQTFGWSWHAAALDTDANGNETWQLDPDYLGKLKAKALTKGGVVTRVPAIPLAAFLFRQKAFPDDSSAADLVSELRKSFNLTDLGFNELFEGKTGIAQFEKKDPLSPEDVLKAIEESGVVIDAPEASTGFQELGIGESDPMLSLVKQLLADGYAGVIFVGPPGTSKSWYAVQIGLALTGGDSTRLSRFSSTSPFNMSISLKGSFPTKKEPGSSCGSVNASRGE